MYAGRKTRSAALKALRTTSQVLRDKAFWTLPASLMGSDMELPLGLEARVEADTTLGEVADWLEQATGHDADTPGGSFGVVWSWLHSELWSRYRQTHIEELHARGAKLNIRSWHDFTRRELEAWAVRSKVAPRLDVLGVDMLHYHYFFGRGQVPRWSVADLLIENPLWSCYQEPRRALQEQLVQRLKAVAMQGRSVRSNLKPLSDLPKESDPLFAQLFRGLEAEREKLEALVSPRYVTLGRNQELMVEPSMTHLVYHERETEADCGHVQGVEVTLSLESEQPVLACTCPYGAHRPCAIKLDAARMMTQALGADAALRQRVTTALSKPTWQRWLDGFLDVLEGDASIPTTMDGVPAWLGWRVEGDELSGVRVRPALVRGYKRGGEGVVTRPLDLDVDDMLAEVEDPRDRELLRMWALMDWSASSGHEWLRMLMQLEGHPRVYHHDGSSVPIAVLRQRFSINAVHGEQGLDFEVRLGDERLSNDRMWEVIGSVRIEHESMKLDRDKGVLRIIEVPDRMVVAARMLDRRQALPDESRARLLQQAPRLTARGVLSLDEGLRGRQVEPVDHMVARLSFEGTALKLAIRAEPLPGGVMVEPGQGPEIVYGVDGEGPLHCSRQMEAEVDRAQALAQELGLDTIDSDLDGWRWVLEVNDIALDVAGQLRDMEEDDLIAVRWDSSPVRFVQAKVGSLKLQIEGRGRDWFSVGGVLDLDEGAVPLDQLLKAAREQRRWIQVDDGRWVRLEERLRRGLEQIAEVADPEDGQVSALAAPRLLDAEDQGIELAGPQRWLTLTRRIRIAAKMTPTLPDDLEATLRPYQREGYDWMTRLAQWAPGACLADDMGLGKTVQALALLLRRADQGPQLVVAPTSVSWGWKEEAARFAPGLDVELVRGQSDLDLLEWVGPYGVLVTSYDLVARYIDRWAAISWSTVVWDEAQALKNPSTRRARAARQLNAEFMLALTGTPIENHTGELWSIFRIVLPGLLGGQTAFRRRFQNPIERHNSAAARQALASLVAPFVLRRLKSQVARDLPERTDVRLTIALSDKERRLYDELRRAVLAELEQAEADGTAQERGQGLRFKLLAAITRLRQLACHPKLYNPSSQVSSSKLQALREKVDEMRHEGHQALVFSQFTSLLKLAREALEEDGVRCAWLDGSLRAADRQKAVETFQQGEADVFLLSIKAGGTGLNLTAASYVFLLDPWWNPAVEDQATDRAHRIGQTQPVTVYRLVAEGTIEEAIYAMHDTKRALMDAVMAGAGSSRALTPEELRDLIATTTTSPLPDDDTESPGEASGSARRLLAAPAPSPDTGEETQPVASAANTLPEDEVLAVPAVPPTDTVVEKEATPAASAAHITVEEETTPAASAAHIVPEAKGEKEATPAASATHTAGEEEAPPAVSTASTAAKKEALSVPAAPPADVVAEDQTTSASSAANVVTEEETQVVPAAPSVSLVTEEEAPGSPCAPPSSIGGNPSNALDALDDASNEAYSNGLAATRQASSSQESPSIDAFADASAHQVAVDRVAAVGVGRTIEHEHDATSALVEEAEQFLEQAVDEGRLSSASVRVYMAKLKRMIAWLDARGHSFAPEQMEERVEQYRTDIRRGHWDAPASDIISATTAGRWLTQVLESRTAP